MNALLSPRPTRARLPIGFLVVAALMYAIDGTIVHSSLFAASPDLLAAAATFDLTIGVTAAYWLIVVRRGRAGRQTTLAVFLASIVTAAITLPAGHRDLVQYVRYLGVPFELAVLGLIVVGVRRAQRRLAAAGVELDVPERIRTLLAASNIRPRVVDIVVTEASMFYFALASWRRKPFVPSGALGFSYHRKNGLAGILYTLVFLTLIEMTALDFVIRMHHPVAANVVLAVDLFAAFWLLGFARAVQLRPIVLTRDMLHVRMGLQWTLDIPRAIIASLEAGRIKAPPRRTPGYLRVAPQPNVILDLAEAVRARGPYGIERTVSRIGLALDDVEKFKRALDVEHTCSPSDGRIR